MKKQGIFILVAICLIFAAFIGGFYLGRYTNRATVSLAVSNEAASTTERSTAPSSQNPSEAITEPTTTGKININTATKEELMSLPEIGETLAERIIEYREKFGDFQEIADLTFVEGMGQKRIEAIKNLITVGG